MRTLLSRRRLLATSTALIAACGVAAAPRRIDPDRTGAQTLIDRWDAAWAAHDATAITALHTADAITVNRFGTVVDGRTALQGAISFLHGPDGPFHRSVFPRQELLALRRIAPKVMVLQTK